jgi:hypothetical protein
MWLTSALAWGPVTRPSGPGKEPGEVDKEEVVDGYPKYMRKM